MAPSFVKLAAAALAYSSSVAAVESYKLTEHYNSTNFFDKFEFFVSDFDAWSTENHQAVDPTHGFVDYKSRTAALDAGLISADGEDIVISVDSTNNDGRGRGSVRIESTSRYNSGLLIAHFTHFPKAACGAWPAFWMYGPNWPKGGELDIYEGWNLNQANSIVGHTANPPDVGFCGLSSGNIVTSNCALNAPGQWANEGCVVSETNGQWANPTGGVYATEWTDTALKVWSWPVTDIPSDITAESPDPSSWGTPHFVLEESGCDVGRAFKDMRLVLDITFCGDAAGNEGLWGWNPDDTTMCLGKTGMSCMNYVNWHASEYEEVYWGVEDIKYFELQGPPTVSSSSVAPSSTPASSSVASSSVASSVVASSSVASSSVASSSVASSSIASSTAAPSSIASSSVASSSVAISSVASSSVASSSVASSSIASSSIASSVASSVASSSIASSSVASSSVASSSVASSSVASSSVASSSIASSSVISSSAISSSDIPSSSVASSSATVTGSVYPSSSPSDSSSVEYSPILTTSTICSTSTYKVTSCAPTSTNCYIGETTTETIPISTTVCTVTPSSSPSPYSVPEEGYTTSTIYATTSYTVTACAPTVTNCPIGKETTEYIPVSTTVCPIGGGKETEYHPEGYVAPTTPAAYVAPPAYTTVHSLVPTAPVVPYKPVSSVAPIGYPGKYPGGGSNTTVPVKSGYPVPAKSGYVAPVKSGYAAPPKSGYPEGSAEVVAVSPTDDKVVTVSGGVKAGASLVALVLTGVALVFGL